MNHESKLQNEIRCALSDYGIVLRLNSGRFWQGKRVWSNEYKQNVLIDLHPIVGCPEGTSDLLFIGQNKTAFIELKTPIGKAKPEQLNFINTIKNYGHIAGIARTVEQAVQLIGGN